MRWKGWFEKKWRDPDDVYIEIERREEERKKLGLAQRLGFHSLSWLGIPVLMITLWSAGLILNSWRDQ